MISLSEDMISQAGNESARLDGVPGPLVYGWYPKLKSGCYLWEPPPAAAKFAVEELWKARLKRQVSTHIFVCPRLMTPSWRKQLSRVADDMFEIPAGSIAAWKADSHEPLLVFLTF
jgi:hypothetical protein